MEGKACIHELQRSETSGPPRSPPCAAHPPGVRWRGPTTLSTLYERSGTCGGRGDTLTLTLTPTWTLTLTLTLTLTYTLTLTLSLSLTLTPTLT